MKNYDGNEMIIRTTNNGKFQVLPENYTQNDMTKAPVFNTIQEAEKFIKQPMPQWLADERNIDSERDKYRQEYSKILGRAEFRDMRAVIQELYSEAKHQSKLAWDAQRAVTYKSGTSCIGRDIADVYQSNADYQANEVDVAWKKYNDANFKYESALQYAMEESGIPINLFRSPVTKLFCFRCEHIWLPRVEINPKFCPKCKSPYWDKPRKS